MSDYAHAKKMKLVLWFEPERVHAGSWLFKEHPPWLLGQGDDRLLNLGNSEARQWLTDHIDQFLTAQGIDLYRQDFNIDPLGFWRANDAPDRQGISEIKHVMGYLAFWDELRRRHPNLLIDSCASGGRRNDLETLRRSVPLLRSDFQAPQNPSDPTMLVGNQGHTYGLSFWVPYYGTGIYYDDVYAFRSHLTPSLGIGYRASEKVDWGRMQRRFAEWKEVAGSFYGDYYPLTPYSLSEKDCIAWQFHQPKENTGMIQAFRRAQSPDNSLTLKLHGLDPKAVYEIKDLDEEKTDPDHWSPFRARGSTLLEKGLPVSLPGRRYAALLTYRRFTEVAAILSASRNECEVHQEVAFSGQDSCSPQGEIISYQWDFGDGTRASGPTVTHRFMGPIPAGSSGLLQVVQLIVKDRRGATDSARISVLVRPIDTVPPALVAAVSGDPEKVAVTFSKPIEKARAATATNYAIDQGVRVLSAALDPDLKTVWLKTSRLREGPTYTLTVNNLRDRARIVHTLARDSRKTFRSTGLYAWWKLNDGRGALVLDSSGNGHHGVLRGNPQWTASTRGMALSFDGVGNVVESDSFFPDLAMPFSITLWVNPAATQVEYADILGNHGKPFVGLNIQQEGTKVNSYDFGFGDGRRWQGAGPALLKANVWQHLAVVCDGEKVVFYVNGVEKSRGPGRGPLAANPGQNVKLGQGYHSGRYFHGLLNDVRIYRKALTSAEVAALAAAAPGI